MPGELTTAMRSMVQRIKKEVDTQSQDQFTKLIRKDFRERNANMVAKFNEGGMQIATHDLGDVPINLIEEAPVLFGLGEALFGGQKEPYRLETTPGNISLTYWEGRILNNREVRGDTRMVGESREYTVLVSRRGREGLKRHRKTIRISERNIQYNYWQLVEYGAGSAAGFFINRLQLAGSKGSVALMSKYWIEGGSKVKPKPFKGKGWLAKEEIEATERIRRFKPVLDLSKTGTSVSVSVL